MDGIEEKGIWEEVELSYIVYRTQESTSMGAGMRIGEFSNIISMISHKETNAGNSKSVERASGSRSPDMRIRDQEIFQILIPV